MGFVYNNVWEAFIKTYLEMNGYFVLTNIYPFILAPVEDGRERRGEADIIAYRLPKTNIPFEEDRTDSKYNEFEPNDDDLIYGEVKANFSRIGHDRHRNMDSIGDILDDSRINRKMANIKDRFNKEIRFVIFAREISEGLRQSISEKGYYFKEFDKVQKYILERFVIHEEKLSILYNDPFLEVQKLLKEIYYKDE